MRQVLFHLPIYFDSLPDGIPLFGYGVMLFIAFVACLFLGSWLAQREGIAPQRIQDMAIFVLLCGILGARVTYFVQYHKPISEFFQIWDGGLVFYGSAIGGLIGYVLAYFLMLRKYHISTWKVADIVAPCAALGLCLGRVGCLLNGCCWGNVACTNCPALHFPLSAPARLDLVNRGLQTAAGFSAREDSYGARVDRVEPGSAAWEAGLRDGDLIVQADGHLISSYGISPPKGSTAKAFQNYLGFEWPKGKTDLQLTVMRQGKEIALPAFSPRTLGLHPTQVYESISMALLCLLLLAFIPFRPRTGMVMVLFMACYALHRFLNEILRKDTDPVAFGMTLSQNISILVLIAALALGGWLLFRKPAEAPASAETSAAGSHA